MNRALAARLGRVEQDRAGPPPVVVLRRPADVGPAAVGAWIAEQTRGLRPDALVVCVAARLSP